MVQVPTWTIVIEEPFVVQNVGVCEPNVTSRPELGAVGLTACASSVTFCEPSLLLYVSVLGNGASTAIVCDARSIKIALRSVLGAYVSLPSWLTSTKQSGTSTGS